MLSAYIDQFEWPVSRLLANLGVLNQMTREGKAIFVRADNFRSLMEWDAKPRSVATLSNGV